MLPVPICGTHQHVQLPLEAALQFPARRICGQPMPSLQ
jgi:hypothetical protein